MFVLYLILNVDMDNYVYKITETIKQGKMCDGTNCLLSGNRESNEILGALEEGIVVIKDEKIIYSNDIFDIIMALTKEKPQDVSILDHKMFKMYEHNNEKASYANAMSKVSSYSFLKKTDVHQSEQFNETLSIRNLLKKKPNFLDHKIFLVNVEE